MSNLDREQYIGNLSPSSTLGFAPERIAYGNVCSRVDLVREHIQKHSLGMGPDDYLGLAHAAQEKGVTLDGTVYFLQHEGLRYKVVLNGFAEIGEELLRIVRTVHRLRERRVPAEVKKLEESTYGIIHGSEKGPYFNQI